MPQPPPPPLPDRIDTAVIGGGISGCAVAFELARRGIEVAVLEAGDLAAMASGANSGSLHAQLPMEPFVEQGEAWVRGFASTTRLLAASIELWRGLEAELGTPLEVSLEGGLLVAESEAQLAAMARKVELERGLGLDSHLLDRNELRELAPYLASGLAGAAFCAQEGKASPLLAGPAFAAAARRAGALIHPFTPVDAIVAETEGYRLRTPRGQLLARRVVIATGAAAGRTAALLDLDLPLWGEPIQASITEPVAAIVPHLVYFAGDKLTLKQTASGGLLIGGGWDARLDGRGRPTVDGGNLARNLAVAARVVPAVAKARLLRSWPGLVNANADWRPVLGPVPGRPGLHFLCFPWMGFTAAPICARLVAQAIAGETPDLAIDEFSIARYGSQPPR
ncbi:MAG: FAD-binding oxidoreductase [Geminicoccaceae bacterium]